MNNKGLTYVELLVVLGISGAIAATAAYKCSEMKDKSVDMIKDYMLMLTMKLTK